MWTGDQQGTPPLHTASFCFFLSIGIGLDFACKMLLLLGNMCISETCDHRPGFSLGPNGSIQCYLGTQVPPSGPRAGKREVLSSPACGTWRSRGSGIIWRHCPWCRHWWLRRGGMWREFGVKVLTDMSEGPPLSHPWNTGGGGLCIRGLGGSWTRTKTFRWCICFASTGWWHLETLEL